jgi:hypothetical protein
MYSGDKKSSAHRFTPPFLPVVEHTFGQSVGAIIKCTGDGLGSKSKLLKIDLAFLFSDLRNGGVLLL